MVCTAIAQVRETEQCVYGVSSSVIACLCRPARLAGCLFLHTRCCAAASPPTSCVWCPQEETTTTSSTPAQQQEQPSTSGRKLSTAEWRAKYEKDGAVDLFLVDQFNAAMVLGRQVADGDRFGIGTGEGPSKGDCATYKVKIYNHYADETVEVEVPEDRCDIVPLLFSGGSGSSMQPSHTRMLQSCGAAAIPATPFSEH